VVKKLMYNLFDKSVFTIYQGNSMELDIYLTDYDTGDYIILENDAYVLFTIKDKSGHLIFQKKLTSSDQITEDKETFLVCTIGADDTLHWITGEYSYDCLYVDGSSVTTFISSTVVVAKAIGKYTDTIVNGGETDG
jgi:hypothetical protein